jgi:hypothetical protein
VGRAAFTTGRGSDLQQEKPRSPASALTAHGLNGT